jgi:hypothetical protein
MPWGGSSALSELHLYENWQLSQVHVIDGPSLAPQLHGFETLPLSVLVMAIMRGSAVSNAFGHSFADDRAEPPDGAPHVQLQGLSTMATTIADETWHTESSVASVAGAANHSSALIVQGSLREDADAGLLSAGHTLRGKVPAVVLIGAGRLSLALSSVPMPRIDVVSPGAELVTADGPDGEQAENMVIVAAKSLIPGRSPGAGLEDVSAAELELLTRGAGLLEGFTPFERGTLEQAIDRFLDQLGGFDDETSELGSSLSLMPHVVTAAVVLGAAEIVRRRMRDTLEGEGAPGDDVEDAGFPGLPGLRHRWASDE